MESIIFGRWKTYFSVADFFKKHNNAGKWMLFPGNVEYADKLCEAAVGCGIVSEAKYDTSGGSPVCFYLDADDTDGHRRVINFFLENNLIPKTKSGRLYNISFKTDKQTHNGEYGENFHSDITLDKFVNLETGEWLPCC